MGYEIFCRKCKKCLERGFRLPHRTARSLDKSTAINNEPSGAKTLKSATRKMEVAVKELKLCYRETGETMKAGKMDSPETVFDYMKGGFDEFPEQEHFYVLLLNRKNGIKGRSLVTVGTATSSLVHPREVFRPAVAASAASIIAVHNHPSGDPSPSSADIQVTRQLREAAKVMAIELLDHIVIGDKENDPRGQGFYSFKEAGLL